MNYLVISSTDESYAQGLSERLWRLHSPNADDASRVTKSWVGYIVNSVDGRIALGPINDATLKISPNATDELADFVSSAVPAGERAKLRTDIAVSKGNVVDVKLFTPASRLINWRTKEQLENEQGWFNE